MADITFKGSPAKTAGVLPAKGSKAPDFQLTTAGLAEVTLADYAGKRLVMNIFPSIDTGVCAMSVRKFNAEATALSNTVVLCISKDLPFAAGRFCAAEGLKDVVTLSEYKNDGFSKNYPVKILDGPLAGLFSRSVVIVDETGTVIYTEQVPEITQEPDYAKALDALKR